MATVGGKPPEGKQAAHWHTGNPAEGKHFLAWVAGPAVLARVHNSKRTKACVRAYRGDGAACEGCVHTLKLDWVYYLPLYREIDDARVVTIHRRGCGEVLEGLRLHQQVRIGRGVRKEDGTWVAPIAGGKSYASGSADRQRDQDICDWLPVLWKLGKELSGETIRRGCMMASSPGEVAVADELAMSIPLIKRNLGLMPDGSKENDLNKRNEAWSAEVKRSSPRTNGEH